MEAVTSVEGDFIFIHHPKCWIALRAVNTSFEDGSREFSEKVSVKSLVYTLKDGSLPMIMEVAAPGDYAGFPAFKKAAKGARLISRNGTHEYQSLSGATFSMSDDRS